jgi:hypothetical protein
VLLLTVGGARMLVSRTSSGASQANDATAVEAFRSWTQQAIPLLVRYRHALAADATPRTASGRLDRLPRDRVERARRRLGALEPAVRQVARRAPSNLQPFMPQLLRSVTLAAEAQARYEAALATHGRRSRLLRGQADVLLRRSQKAMAAFSFGVNGVGGRLTGS